MSSAGAGNSDAAHEFGALNTLLFVVILGLCILAAYMIKIHSFYYLPECAAAIFVGLIVGGLARVVYPSVEEMAFLSFQSELFFFLLLPPIIFEAAYSLNKKDFFSNFWSISLFAVCGTIISTFMFGYMVYYLGVLKFVHIDTSSPMEALLFGALISSVDPVATLSIMGNADLNCDPLLYSLVFGESVLNDAVCIVLFNTFMRFYDSGEPFSTHSIPPLLLNFATVSLASLVCGVGIGFVCCYICKHTQLRKFPEYEISLILLFAYGSYAFCESLELSGIMGLFFNGVVLSHYNTFNLSSTSQVTAHNIFKSFRVLCDFFVYLFIGMGIFTGRFRHWNFSFAAICILLCLLTRCFNIFPLSWVANMFRKGRQISPKMQVVMWFAGIRGAICFALSMQIPGEHRDVYISSTLLIVVFTTVVFGGLTEPVVTGFGMRLPSTASNSTADYQYELVSASEDSQPSISSSRSGNTDKNSFFKRFDQEYLSPLFGGPPETPNKDGTGGRDTQLLRTETGEVFEPMHFLISSSNPPSAQTSPARSQGDYHATTGTAVSSGGYVTSLHGSIAGAQGLPMSFPGSLSVSNTANNNSNNSSANISSGGSVGQFAGSTTQIAASKIPNHPNNQRDGARVVSSDIRADGHRRKGGKNVNT